MIPYITINQRLVGSGNPVYVIAEIGSNHNQDLELAKRLIRAAAQAGVDAVKFQAFRAKYHFSRHTPGVTYLKEQGHQQSLYELIESLEINPDWHEHLMRCSQENGVEFLSSPCDYQAIDQLAQLGMAAFKVASFDLPDIHLIKYMAGFHRPLLLSTGLADYADIQNALKAAKSQGNEQVALLQCTSLYPAPPHLANLAAMETMRQAFKVPVGYSDHTLGDHVALAAVAMGASIIEKHFTLDRKLPGPDHPFAIEPEELAVMLRRIREVEAAFGDGVKDGPREAESEMFAKGRRSLHVIRGVKAGGRLERDNLCVKRPGYGIPPQLLEVVAGMTATRDIPEDSWITWEALK